MEIERAGETQRYEEWWRERKKDDGDDETSPIPIVLHGDFGAEMKMETKIE